MQIFNKTLTITLGLLTLLGVDVYAQYEIAKIDRYTYIDAVSTKEQNDPMSVIVSVKFPTNITNAKDAIDYLLVRSGFNLSEKYETYKLKQFTLPQVHRVLGPITLKNAIKVLVGKGRYVNVDYLNRVITIPTIYSTKDTIKTVKSIKRLEVNNSLLEKIKVHIENENLSAAIQKILPADWEVVVNDGDINKKTTNIITEDKTIKQVVNAVLKASDIKGYFYPEMKVLVLEGSSNEK